MNITGFLSYKWKVILLAINQSMAVYFILTLWLSIIQVELALWVVSLDNVRKWKWERQNFLV